MISYLALAALALHPLPAAAAPLAQPASAVRAGFLPQWAPSSTEEEAGPTDRRNAPGTVVWAQVTVNEYPSQAAAFPQSPDLMTLPSAAGERSPGGLYLSETDSAEPSREAPKLGAPTAREGSNQGEPGSPASLLNELAEGITRATTQGALDLAPGRENDSPVAQPNPQRSEDTNIRLRLPGEEAWITEETSRSDGCAPDGSLDVAAWGPGESDAAEAIMERRRSLVTDLDAIDEERSLALARLYLSLGFGAEARAIINVAAPRHRDAQLLSTLALIVDGDPVPKGALDAFKSCGGRVQLWITLASHDPGNPKDVIVALSELPLGIRRLVGPHLMDVYLEAGDRATAETIRATVERATGPHGSAFDLAAARLDAGLDEPLGLQTIRDIAANASPASDQALLLLLETSNERGDLVDATSMALARFRADDLQGTYEGTQLRIGLIRAHLRHEEFDHAASHLRNGGLPTEAQTRLAQEYFLALAERAPDDAVLVHAAGLRDQFSASIRTTSAGLALSARLLDLGLPAVAKDYMPTAADDAASQFLWARLRLASGDPLGALDLLARMEPLDSDQRRLRADALSAVGRHDEAARVRSELAEGNEDLTGPSDQIVTGPDTEPRAVASNPGSILVDSEMARRQIDALLAPAPNP